MSRQTQDEFAVRSHAKAVAAIDAGKFRDEIVPVQIPGKKGPTTVDTDEGPRRDTTLDTLGKLKPAFASNGARPEDLTVTAGNASPMNLAPRRSRHVGEYASAHGLTMIARINAYATGRRAARSLLRAD